MRKALIAIGILFALLVALLVARACQFRPRRHPIEPAASIEIDARSAALHLSEALRFPSISHEDRASFDAEAFSSLHAYLARTYPKTHGELERELAGERSLLFTWRGEEPALPAAVLMAHQDVVPIEPGTEGDWSQPPFGGEIAEGYV